MRIHFTGIKGVGMASLALIAHDAGHTVSGSDIAETFITDKQLHSAGIPIYEGFDRALIDGIDCLIATGAHGGKLNPQVQSALHQGVPVLMHGQAVGEFMEGTRFFGRSFTGVSITGCHGKTTTTAMIATLLSYAKLDPSYTIGTGSIPSLPRPGKLGKGEYFVAEADEYVTDTADLTPKLLWQYPKIAIVTNVEFDHPDVYLSIDEIFETYAEFTHRVPRDGCCILNADDPYTKRLSSNISSRVLTFGYAPESDIRIIRTEYEDSLMRVYINESDVPLITPMIGRHNAMNLAAAYALGIHIGLSPQQIRDGLATYDGSQRRLEYKGMLTTGALWYDDYAHHPTEIRSALHALKEKYPNRKLLCIFQPHTYTRTKKLFDDFSTSFVSADQTLLVDIFSSAREQADKTVDSSILAKHASELGYPVIYGGSVSDVIQWCNAHELGDDTIVVTMGAGDVYRISEYMRFVQNAD